MKVRKQVYELTPSDLDKFPVWEFALDEEGEEGQDEATVKPRKSSKPVDSEKGMFIVKASFTLASGKKFIGYVTPPVQGDDSTGTIQPIIVTTRGQVCFWNGMMKPTMEEIKRNYEILENAKPSDVFPLKYVSMFPVLSGIVKGQLNGFMYLIEGKNQDVIKEIQ